jgi:hypothetical protein
VGHEASADAGASLEHTHAVPEALDPGLDGEHVTGVHRTAVAHALDAAEEDQQAAVLGLGQDEDGPDLRDDFRQDGGREGRPAVFGGRREIALVDRDVLDADDARVGFELGDAIDQQERIAMRKNAFDGRVIAAPSVYFPPHPA